MLMQWLTTQMLPRFVGDGNNDDGPVIIAARMGYPYAGLDGRIRMRSRKTNGPSISAFARSTVYYPNGDPMEGISKLTSTANPILSSGHPPRILVVAAGGLLDTCCGFAIMLYDGA